MGFRELKLVAILNWLEKGKMSGSFSKGRKVVLMNPCPTKFDADTRLNLTLVCRKTEALVNLFPRQAIKKIMVERKVQGAFDVKSFRNLMETCRQWLKRFLSSNNMSWGCHHSLVRSRLYRKKWGSSVV